MAEKPKAFSGGEVASLNAYQESGIFHPFTCGNIEHEEHVNLVAAEQGWYCPAMVDEGIEEYCGYTQTWAHDFMKDWSWRRLVQPWRNEPEEQQDGCLDG